MKQDKIYYFLLTTLLCLINAPLFSVGESEEDDWVDIDPTTLPNQADVWDYSDLVQHPEASKDERLDEPSKTHDYTPKYKSHESIIPGIIKNPLNQKNIESARQLLQQPTPTTDADKLNFQKTMSKLDINDKNKLVQQDKSKLNANHFRMLSQNQVILHENNQPVAKNISIPWNDDMADSMAKNRAVKLKPYELFEQLDTAFNAYKNAVASSTVDPDLRAELFKNAVKIWQESKYIEKDSNGQDQRSNTFFNTMLQETPALKDSNSEEFKTLITACFTKDQQDVLLQQLSPLPKNYTADDLQPFVLLGKYLLSKYMFLKYDPDKQIFQVRSVTLDSLLNNAAMFDATPAGKDMSKVFLQSFREKLSGLEPDEQIQTLNALIHPKDPKLDQPIKNPKIYNFLIQCIKERAEYYKKEFEDLDTHPVKSKAIPAFMMYDDGDEYRAYRRAHRKTNESYLKFLTLLQDAPTLSSFMDQQQQARAAMINPHLKTLGLPETVEIPTPQELEKAHQKAVSDSTPKKLKDAHGLPLPRALKNHPDIQEFDEHKKKLDAAKQALQNLASTQQA